MSRLLCPAIAFLLVALAILTGWQRTRTPGPRDIATAARTHPTANANARPSAASHSGPRKSLRSSTIKSSTDLLSDAKEHFQAENYELANAHAQLALMVDPENRPARELLSEIDQVPIHTFYATNSDAHIRDGYSRSRVQLGVQAAF